jgi:electron transfer flavoprotein beta subunit
MKAKRKPLKKIDFEDLNINVDKNFEMMEFRTQPERKAGQIIDSIDSLMDKINPIIKTI